MRIGKAYLIVLLSFLFAGLFLATRPLCAQTSNTQPIPILEYKFEEGSGTTVLNSGSFTNADGTLQNGLTVGNGPLFSLDTPSGIGSKFSLSFDGVNDFVRIPDHFNYTVDGKATSPPLNQLTLEAWIKPQTVILGPFQKVIWDDYGNPGVLMTIFADGRLQWNISTTQHPGLGISLVAGKIIPGIWQHVAGTYDGSRLKIFVNGNDTCASVSTSGGIQDNSTIHPTGAPIAIGADSVSIPALNFPGLIDDVRVYSSALDRSKLANGFFANIPAGFCGIRVVDTISTANIDLDTTSFSKTPISITVDAQNNKTIIEWQYDSFSIGQIEDLSFDVILKNPIPGEDRLVNHKLELLYSDADGNPVRTELGPQSVHVLSSAFNTSVSTDKTEYTSNENVAINLSITNLSEFQKTIDAILEIKDMKGNLVTTVKTLPGLIFNAGETKTFQGIIFNTGSTLAGDYQVNARLMDGTSKAGEAKTTFKILPVKAAQSKIVSDKISYSSNETVTLTSAIISQSINSTITKPTAKVSVTDPNGSTIFSETKNLPDLLPQSRYEFKSFTNSGTNPAGFYTAILTLSRSTGEPFSTSSARFEILSSAKTGAGLIGSLTPSPNPIHQGKNLSLAYSISNMGNSDLSNIPIKILIVDPDTKGLKETLFTTIAGLLMGGITAGNLTSSTLNLTPKIYLAILKADIGDGTKTLAQSIFEVLPGLEIKKTIPDLVRVLVWINEGCGKNEVEGKKESHDEDKEDERCIRKDLIERSLKEIGVSYSIVQEKKAFQKELRNNYYTDYLILGNHNPIEDHFDEELRERIFSGRGLIISPQIGEDEMDEIFSIKREGRLKGEDLIVEFIESGVFSAQTYQSSGRAAKIKESRQEDIMAWIKDKDGLSYPGVIRHQYGKGLGLFFAFDLGLSINEESYNQSKEILRSSLSYIHLPQEQERFNPFDLVPIEIGLESLGAPFDINIAETYPAEIRLFDPESGKWIKENPWVKEVRLNANETKTIRLFALAPDKIGLYILTSDVDLLQDGIWIPFQAHSVNIQIDRDSSRIISDILEQLKNLAPLTNKESEKVEKAKKEIEKIKDRVINSIKDLEKDIHDLLGAIKALLEVQSIDTQGIRLDMDRLLVIYTERWYLGL